MLQVIGSRNACASARKPAWFVVVIGSLPGKVISTAASTLRATTAFESPGIPLAPSFASLDSASLIASVSHR